MNPPEGPLAPAALHALLRRLVAEACAMAPDEIEADRPLADYGLSSRDAVGITGELEEALNRRLPATLLWENPSLAELVRHLTEETPEPAAADDRARAVPPDAPDAPDALAVVGIGCRLPGGIANPDAFWEFLLGGGDAVGEVPAERWRSWGADTAAAATALPPATRWGAFLDDVAGFDAQFFGITPREADLMDPQQRLLLEVVWEALNHAGMPPPTMSGSSTGVYVGLSSLEYGFLTAADLSRVTEWTSTGSAGSIVANRVSYVLDLRGPSLTVDTACSSSLVALHQAGRGLRLGECDTALVAGVNVLLSPMITAGFDQAGVLAPDGRCRPFDAAAQGIVRGEGCGVVVLKRLADAVRDRHSILAVVRGTAVNSDGRSSGLVAPNPVAQRALLRAALRDAGVGGAEVDYVETHGTGTLLGDPIEAGALSAVLGPDRPADRPLLIGSVKSNLGHLEGAAGITGVIKTVLALHHGTLPATAHFQRPNPHIDFTAGHLRVVSEATPWPPAPDRPARAGVSAFGFGGTNAHAVLERWDGRASESAAPAAPAGVRARTAAMGVPGVAPGAPSAATGAVAGASTGAGPGAAAVAGASSAATTAAVPGASSVAAPSAATAGVPRTVTAAVPSGAPRILVVSARSADRLGDTALGLADWLAGAAGARASLDDVAWTLGHHRYGSVCAAVVGRDREALVGGLRALGDKRAAKGVVAPRPALGATQPAGAGPVFVFSGYGSQWAGMGRHLLAHDDAFAAAVDDLDPVFAAEAGKPLSRLISEGVPLTAVAGVQPLLYGLQLALVRTWHAYGVEPAAVIGHSMGEVAAAVVAGVLDPAAGLRVILRRSELLSAVDADQAGAMAAVALPWDERAETLARFPGVEVAVDASPLRCTVAGPAGAVGDLVAELDQKGVQARLLDVGGAGHTAAVDAVLPDLRTAFADLRPRRPTIPWYGTVHDDPRLAPPADTDYWCDNARRPVRFRQAVAAAAEDGHRAFLEISPHPVAAAATRETFDATADAECLVLPTLLRDSDEPTALRTSLAALHTAGVQRRPDLLWPTGRRTSLPTTPWRHTRHWVAARTDAPVPTGTHPLFGAHPLLGTRLDVPGTRRALWRGELRADGWPGLDQRVHGTSVLPLAVCAETVVAAAAEVFATAPDGIVVHGLTLDRPLPLADGTPLTTLLDPTGPGRATVSLHTRSAAGTWTRHASATVEVGAPRDAWGRGRLDGEPEEEPGGEPGGETFTVELPAAPAPEGPPTAWRFDPAVLDACLRAPASAAARSGPGGEPAAPVPEEAVPVAIGRLHIRRPAPAAGVCHVRRSSPAGDETGAVRRGDRAGSVRAVGGSGFDRAGEEGGVVPAGGTGPIPANDRSGPVGDRVGGVAPGGQDGHFAPGGEAGRIAPGDRDGTSARWRWSVCLADADGGVVVEAEGIELRVPDARELPLPVGDMAYGIAWERSPLPDRRSAAPGAWLLLTAGAAGVAGAERVPGAAGTGGTAEAGGAAGAPGVAGAERIPGAAGSGGTAKTAEAAGPGGAAGSPGAPGAGETAGTEGSGDRTATALRAALERAGGRVTVELVGADTSGRAVTAWYDNVADDAPAAVVLLCTEPAGPDGARETILATADVARSLAAATTAGRGPSTRFFLVTEGAEPVTGAEPGDPDQGCLRGLLRVLALEHPELRPCLVDADGAVDGDGAVDDLARELLGDDAADHVAWRAGTRFTARLTRVDPGAETGGVPFARPHGAYIVTGGLGGLGLATARRLAERGAGRLVLNGRRPPSAEAEAVLRELRALGAEVDVVLGDIAEPGTAPRLVVSAVRHGHTLRGVAHAAGVLRDAVLTGLEPDDLDAVFRPKAEGGRHLDEATAGHDLDWWLVFSSAAGLLGSPGQAAYAAANAYLDALVRRRRARGAVSQSIAWGPWAGTGGAPDPTALALDPLTPDEGLDALQTVIGGGRVYTGVVRLDARRVARAFPGIGSVPFFAGLLGGAAEETDEPFGLDRLRRLDRTSALHAVGRRLAARVATVMGFAEQEIDPTVPLTELGLDSLVAVRLRNAVQQDFGIALPETLLLRGGSLDAAASAVAAALGLTAPSDGPPAPGAGGMSAADADGGPPADMGRTSKGGAGGAPAPGAEGTRAPGVGGSPARGAGAPRGGATPVAPSGATPVPRGGATRPSGATPAPGVGSASGGRPAPPLPSAVLPRDAAERLVAGVWAQVSGQPAGSVYEELHVCRDDAALSVAFAEGIRARLGGDGAAPTAARIRRNPTVAAVADLVRAALEDGPGDSALRVLRGPGARTDRAPLFVFHPAGGSTSVYRPLTDRLPPGQPVFGLDRVESLTSVEDKAEHYLRLMRQVQSEGPYRLLGWSFGGCLAYETAAQLRERGEPVGYLGLIDTILPAALPGPSPEEILLERFARFAEYVETAYGRRLRLPYEEMAAMDEEAQVETLMRHVAEAGLDMSPGVLEHQRTSYIDARIGERYRPRPYPEPVVLYRAQRAQALTTAIDPRYLRDDADLGWAPLCPRLEVVPVSGDHLSLIDPPHVDVIAGHLATALNDPA